LRAHIHDGHVQVHLLVKNTEKSGNWHATKTSSKQLPNYSKQQPLTLLRNAQDGI
jgi:hypothetical protein